MVKAMLGSDRCDVSRAIKRRKYQSAEFVASFRQLVLDPVDAYILQVYLLRVVVLDLGLELDQFINLQVAALFKVPLAFLFREVRLHFVSRLVHPPVKGDKFRDVG
jgi:uncharacterized membrane protein